jgi:hypothetical protein
MPSSTKKKKKEKRKKGEGEKHFKNYFDACRIKSAVIRF